MSAWYLRMMPLLPKRWVQRMHVRRCPAEARRVFTEFSVRGVSNWDAFSEISDNPRDHNDLRAIAWYLEMMSIEIAYCKEATMR